MKAHEQGDDVVTSIRLPRPTHTKFRELAASEHRTVSGEIRRLVEEHIAERDEQVAA